MKNLLSFKRWICNACVYFTAISLFLLLVNLAMTGTDSETAVTPTAFLLIFPASLLMSAAGILLALQALPRWARFLGHYGITTLSFFLFLWLPAGSFARPSTTLIVVVLFSIIYWFLFLMIHLVRSRIRRLMEEDD
ncbi:MAG: hypothetical protein IJX28_04070 [Clostridia bacterium]|nr:hypothetical protein [Clostridia bacterium]